jgi:hypothetical protein
MNDEDCESFASVIEKDENLQIETKSRFMNYKNFVCKNKYFGFGEPWEPFQFTIPFSFKTKIQIVGINTAIFSKKKEVRNSLIVNPRQYLIQRNNMAKIALLHHPLSWFVNEREVERYIKNRFCMTLMGHEHEPRLSKDELFTNLFVYSGALNPSSAEINEYRYNWIILYEQVVENERQLIVLLAPRKWSRKTKFEPDFQFLENRDSIFFEKRISLAEI